jgi:hypothetical protein
MAAVAGDVTVEGAATLMARLGVDTLVVLDDADDAVGVVTDRDLVVRVLARGLAPGETFVAEIMTSPLPKGMDLDLSELGVGPNGRSGPLVLNDRYEVLSSLLALDDALALVDRELGRRSGEASSPPPRAAQGENGTEDGAEAADRAERNERQERQDRQDRRRRRREPPGHRRPPRAWG